MNPKVLLKLIRNKVQSSNIKSIGYDSESRTLVIEFPGAIWGYTPITPECYRELMTAESHGKYFYAKIKTNPSVTSEKLM